MQNNAWNLSFYPFFAPHCRKGHQIGGSRNRGCWNGRYVNIPRCFLRRHLCGRRLGAGEDPLHILFVHLGSINHLGQSWFLRLLLPKLPGNKFNNWDEDPNEWKLPWGESDDKWVGKWWNPITMFRIVTVLQFLKVSVCETNSQRRWVYETKSGGEEQYTSVI